MNKPLPLVSVCVQTYNQKEYIKQCLDSILMQQTNFPFEIILGEDESDDGTREICIEYANKHSEIITLFLRSRDDVIYINDRPTGRYNFMENVKASSGKYIALCEGDDYWTDPLKLQKQIDFLENDLNYVLCFHMVNILKPDGQIVEDYITKVPIDYECIEALTRFGNYIHTPSVVFRNVIDEFPFEFKEVPFGDWFLYMMLAQYGKLKYIKEIMSVYRSDIGLISKMSEKNLAASYIKLYSCMISYFKKEELKKIILEKQLEAATSYWYLMEDKYWVLKNKYKESFISNHKFFNLFKFFQSKYWKLKSKSSKNINK